MGSSIFALLGVYVFVTQKTNINLSDNQNVQNSNTSESQNYYEKLANECKSKQSESCCLASVEAMKQGGYTLAPAEGCPAGYQPNMMRCIDSFRWCQPVEKTTNNVQTQSVPFLLDFFAGGSIFGSSFEVKISGATVTYRETTQDGDKEVQKFERVLSPAEIADIQKIVADTKLISLQSQDFTKEPLVPDQAPYRITVSLDGKRNTIHCGIPLSGTQPANNCQKQIDKLRLKLNSILGVNIY
jgi:hypothetical protein